MEKLESSRESVNQPHGVQTWWWCPRNQRICVDLKPLNQSVLREVHPLPKVDETLAQLLAQLAGARNFSKLDANRLTKSSRLLTTFITPTGRYCFNKLPFGISSTPEHFQQGLEAVLCQMDDILVFWKDQGDHDQQLTAVLTRIMEAGATLNPEKCEFGKTTLKFLGHIIDSNGIRADPDKTDAISQQAYQLFRNIAKLRQTTQYAD